MNHPSKNPKQNQKRITNKSRCERPKESEGGHFFLVSEQPQTRSIQWIQYLTRIHELDSSLL